MSDQLDPFAYSPQGTMFNDLADGKDHTFDYIPTDDVDPSLTDLFMETIPKTSLHFVSFFNETPEPNQVDQPIHQVPGQYHSQSPGFDGFVPSHSAYPPNPYVNNEEPTFLDSGRGPMLSDGMYPEFTNLPPLETGLPNYHNHWRSSSSDDVYQGGDANFSPLDCEINENRGSFSSWGHPSNISDDVESPEVKTFVTPEILPAAANHRTVPPKRYKKTAIPKDAKPRKAPVRRPRRVSTAEHMSQQVPQLANRQQKKAEDVKEKRKAAVRKCRQKMTDYLTNAPAEIAYKSSVCHQVEQKNIEAANFIAELKSILDRTVPQYHQQW